MCLDNATLKACKINTSILLGEKSLRSQLVLIFPTANVPRVASPRIVFLWIFLVFFLSFFLSFFLLLTNKQNKTKTGKYTRRMVNIGGKSLGESQKLSRVMGGSVQ